MENKRDLQAFELLFDQMIITQQKKLLECARRIIPSVTTDDILQPNDFPELENHPYFRYEEGLLAGLQSAQMAFRAEIRE
jgi:hypothetical protein